MTLETKRLVLRVADRREMEALCAREKDPETAKAYGEMLRGALDHPDQWPWYAAWLLSKKDGTPVGDLCFKGMNSDGSVEIGYGLLEIERGKGYATEAVNTAVRWALEQKGVVRVEAESAPDNLASQRVLEKCGFLPTGTYGEEGPRFYTDKETKGGGKQ